jgi:hypothetical protein
VLIRWPSRSQFDLFLRHFGGVRRWSCDFNLVPRQRAPLDDLQCALPDPAQPPLPLQPNRLSRLSASTRSSPCDITHALGDHVRSKVKRRQLPLDLPLRILAPQVASLPSDLSALPNTSRPLVPLPASRFLPCLAADAAPAKAETQFISPHRCRSLPWPEASRRPHYARTVTRGPPAPCPAGLARTNGGMGPCSRVADGGPDLRNLDLSAA